MTDPSENDCSDCGEDYSFQCESCGYYFCGPHAEKHDEAECDRYIEDKIERQRDAGGTT